MAVQKASGEENLRANETIKTGKMTDSPSGSGKDAGGTENLRASYKVLNGADQPTPTDYQHDVPPGIQSFDDNGQKEGGTKYLGR
jgi:hypothetical protein